MTSLQNINNEMNRLYLEEIGCREFLTFNAFLLDSHEF